MHTEGEDRYPEKQQKLEEGNVKLERRQRNHAVK